MNKANSDNLSLYFFFTLTLTWYMGFLPFFLGQREASTGFLKLTDGAIMIPSIVGVIIVFASYNAEEKRDYLKRLLSFKHMGIRWPISAMLFYAVVCGITILVSTFLLDGEIPEFDLLKTFIQRPYMIIIFFILAFMGGPLHEEFGWRGFALDKLFVRFGFWAGSVILGFIWGIWHFPWYFYQGDSLYILWHISPIHGIMFILSTITLSCIISIVYIKTNRSILSAFFVHTFVNFFIGVLPGSCDEKYLVASVYVQTVLEILVILYFINNFKFRYEVKTQIALLKRNIVQ